MLPPEMVTWLFSFPWTKGHIGSKKGMPTYVEPIASIHAWTSQGRRQHVVLILVREHAPGLPQVGDLTFDRTHTWGRPLGREGCFCLLADVFEIFGRQTNNAPGLENASSWHFFHKKGRPCGDIGRLEILRMLLKNGRPRRWGERSSALVTTKE